MLQISYSKIIEFRKIAEFVKITGCLTGLSRKVP